MFVRQPDFSYCVQLELLLIHVFKLGFGHRNKVSNFYFRAGRSLRDPEEPNSAYMHQLQHRQASGVPQMSPPIHQEHGWSRVGAQGRHKHVPSEPGTLNSSPLHDCQLSLLALPATALASIFQHLDSVDSFNLAQTCHVCATEFAHQKADFAQKVWRELALTVTRDPPKGHPLYGTKLYGTKLYGTNFDPVELCVNWEKKPGSALRRFYAISQQPDGGDLMNELWRQAWPEALWPARRDQLQEIMAKDWYYYPGNDVHYHSGYYDAWEYDPTDCFYYQAWAPPHAEVCGDLYRKACHEEMVAITGDDMVVDLKHTAAQLEDSWRAHFGCLAVDW
ncbi:hypothetical protein WJX82_008988 [Trebouxia sp. C0006]